MISGMDKESTEHVFKLFAGLFVRYFKVAHAAVTPKHWNWNTGGRAEGLA